MKSASEDYLHSVETIYTWSTFSKKKVTVVRGECLSLNKKVLVGLIETSISDPKILIKCDVDLQPELI